MRLSAVKSAIFVAAFTVPASVFAVPSISDVSVTAEGNLFTIAYTLSGEDAIVTADILTNGVSIGGANLDYLSGDVNALVAAGPDKVVKWRADLAWPMHEVSPASASVELKAFPPSSPPQYMVVNLDRLDTASAVSYYESLDHLPRGGLTNAIYKTSRIVFRRIPSAGTTYRMGYDGNEPSGVGWQKNNGCSPCHVTFTKDFYCAIYELTGAQAAYIADAVQPEPDVASHPNVGPNVNAYTGANGLLDTLRSRTGMSAFNLPTSAQWEFAARAGERANSHNGFWIPGNGDYPDLRAIAWHNKNAGSVSHEVGLLQPNNYGLYDVQGNVAEMCLDLVPPSGWTDRTGQVLTDPQGYQGTDATSIVLRGSHRWAGPDYLLVWAIASEQKDRGPNNFVGVRLVFNID
jgi:formylglycine-generating enzyme required for sulfatase activity